MTKHDRCCCKDTVLAHLANVRHRTEKTIGALLKHSIIFLHRHLGIVKALYGNLSGWKAPIVRTEFYRLMQLVNLVGTAAYLSAISLQTQVPVLNNYLVLQAVGPLIWGVFYLLQLLPSIGHYVIIVEKMVGDMIHFEAIFWLLLLPFPICFYLALQDATDCSTSSDFSSVAYMFYDTFLLLLNMFDMSHYMHTVEHAWLLFFTHLLFFIIIVVMTLNFLIALFSNTVAEITRHAAVIMPLQRLSVTCLLEWRCRSFSLLRRYYRHKLKRCPQFICENGKVYLQTIESVYKEE